ncbi:MAG: EF-hand domain-containing protein [Hydrogenophaga sp.]|uniref:EF-hand domain-containing protein n=1 Tax=Hydrogenophaga sp. TaxID=1904254 RepID=UPI0025C714F9|nr:EF-hand domain-containing protein [Hydrogenophaga sp.]MBT9553787.1 EF-hand domain-containing protein [Hydrogenophaga sp.]
MSTVESTSAWAQTLSSISSALSTHLQDKMLKKMDTDSSGGVDQTEFKAALEKVAGKLGVDAGEGAEALYASLDADSDGSLNGSEVGQLLQQLFTPPSDTQAFVQSRGDEARFAELDADADGQISMAEFGITPEASLPEGTVVSTTTTTTVVSTIHEPITGTEGTTGVAAAAPAASTAVDTAAATPEADSTGVTQAAVSEEQLQALMSSVDADGDGEISGAELNTFMAQISAQAEAATRRYNETALAGTGTTSTSTLNATA